MNLASLVAGALEDLDLEHLVARALPEARARPACVVAIGKAAPAMARGAIARWGQAIERCLVVAPDGTDARGLGSSVVRASHPLPDARSLRAARLALDLVATAEPRLVLVLVSGGASSLVCAPAPGVTLADKRAVTSAMLRSGASVHDTNIVRKHLSRIKGGGLLRAAGQNRVVTLLASDVIGGTASDIGSGPSVGDPSTLAEARRLLRHHAPRYADLPLVRTFAGSPHRPRVPVARILASPETFARAVAQRLRDAGVAVRVARASTSPVTELARAYVALARRLPKGTAIVRAAEPAIEVPARAGRGGRCTHLAALVARDLPRGATFLAFATDGVDGTSGTSGALVRGGALPTEALERAIARFDTGALHVAHGTALPPGPTGQNLADLHVLLV